MTKRDPILISEYQYLNTTETHAVAIILDLVEARPQFRLRAASSESPGTFEQRFYSESAAHDAVSIYCTAARNSGLEPVCFELNAVYNYQPHVL